MGLFDRIKAGLKKTNQLLQTDVRDLFKQEGALVDEAFLDKLLETIVKSDMGVETAYEIIERIKKEYRGRVVHQEDVEAVIKTRLREEMPPAAEPIALATEGPTVIMVVGVNGSGKTTSIAKLAKRYADQKKKIVLGAGDTFRAAAVEQLGIWADRLGCQIVRGEHGADPASVAHRAVTAAVDSGADICIVDTAGRLHTQDNLMQELGKVHRVIGKVLTAAPHEVLLVLDATAGQNGIRQAEGFQEAAQCTGLILAKIDGSAKGGVIIPIRRKFDLPVKFIGVGEGPDDLALFDPDEFLDALFAKEGEG